jgi:hypothetical protein
VSGVLARITRQLHLDRPAVRAWMLYDWANSAMYVVIVTAIFPTFFSAVAAQGLPPVEATYRFSLATTLGLTIIAVLSPISAPSPTIPGQTAARRLPRLGATAVARCSSARPVGVRGAALHPRQHRQQLVF